MSDKTYATGRRKEATARVWVKPGSGKITVNNKDIVDYFTRPALRMILKQPLAVTETKEKYDVWCTVKGGGQSGQAGAVRHGLAHALARADGTLRPKLKRAGHLTRDARVVERKKYGQPKARKNFQFSKR